MSNGHLHADPPTRSLTGVQIIGSGSYVPERVVTNEHLRQSLGFDPDWIVNRTGIQERRFAPPHQATSDLCALAAARCLEVAECDPAEVDLMVVGTMTPDMCFPSTACLVQDRLLLSCPAFDLQAACAGFMYALVTAAQFVAAGTSRRALVIGGDTNSRVINPGDQKSYPLFGDGAGAVLLAPGSPEQGLVAYQLGSDGSGGDLLNRPACGSRMPPTVEALERGLHYLTMDGRAVFKWAVRILADSAQAVLERAERTVADVRWFIPHQANIRIIHAASDVLGFSREAVFKNLDRYGNTSGGSIPIALDELLQQGRVRRGDLLLTSGFGAGLTWGTALWRW
ncbi:MAG TPA: beta-ketoacyl-ACP synthase III [Isosphaeraceae bacterium]|jgi:3-oxoacyl-[acyl-carrier-protein] synthase-3|nr:beta-ketoacyl-ACP synthase III [Isosphaeraceae bacterium]